MVARIRRHPRLKCRRWASERLINHRLGVRRKDDTLPALGPELSGSDSGFNFAVNDEMLLSGVRDCRLKDGDRVENVPALAGDRGRCLVLGALCLVRTGCFVLSRAWCSRTEHYRAPGTRDQARTRHEAPSTRHCLSAALRGDVRLAGPRGETGLPYPHFELVFLAIQRCRREAQRVLTVKLRGYTRERSAQLVGLL